MDSDAEIVAEFITESMENLDDLDSELLSLEQDPENKEILNQVFRAIHTVKGGAGFLNLDEITNLSHKLENVLDDLRNGLFLITPEILDVVLESIDSLKKLLDILTQECETAGSTKDIEFDLAPIINKLESVKEAKTSNEKPQEANTPPTPEEASTQNIEESYTATTDIDDLDDDLLFQNLLEENKKTFIDETREYIGTVDNELIKLEKDDDASAALDVIFRIIHNIKGNSAYLGFAKIEKLTHNFENILDDLRKGKLEVNPGICKLLFDAFDKFKAIFEIVVNTGNDSSTNEEIETIITEINNAISENQLDTPKKEVQTIAQDNTNSDNNEPIDGDTIDIFLRNAEIHLNSIETSINQLNCNRNDNTFHENLSRAIHSLCNAASFTNFPDLKNMLSSTTALLETIKTNNTEINNDIIKLLSKTLEDSKQFVNNVKEKGSYKLDQTIIVELSNKCDEIKNSKKVEKPVIVKPTATAIENTPPVAKTNAFPAKPKEDSPDKKKGKQGKVDQTIRVEYSKLDTLMNLIGELIISRNHLEMISEKIKSDYNIPELSKEISRASVSLGKISDDLQNSIMAVRMIPVGTVFNKFPRVVRDLAKVKEKSIELKINGEETNLDKTIIEQIGDPLVHLIRNGVDHGIETPQARKDLNKPEKGTIELRAFQKADNVFIEIEDDGKGMDPVIIRNKAVEKGIISEEDATKLSKDESLNLIFEAGFSTAEKITDISGRGVGMDVVRNNIKKLGGHVFITSEKGFGSKFTLTLPLTLAIIRAIMIKLEGNIYAVPINAIVETIKIPKENIKSMKNKKVIDLRGEVIGIVDLLGLMDIQHNGKHDDNDLVSIVIISEESKKIGFIVDELLRQQEIVIKPLVDFLAVISGLSGATILGDGKIVLILDPSEIVALATESKSIEEAGVE